MDKSKVNSNLGSLSDLRRLDRAHSDHAARVGYNHRSTSRALILDRQSFSPTDTASTKQRPGGAAAHGPILNAL
jgi:hypothetical protein